MIKGITVEKMESEVQSGDWHDKPLKWEVKGPGNERQMFSTKADASKYASIRRKSSSFNEACSTFGKAN